MRPVTMAFSKLKTVLERRERLIIAVSGGVDSMTLAHVAYRVMGAERVEVCHAISPAVPAAATRRVQKHAARHGWRLRLLDAGEFLDPDYVRNPVNRCYFCKSNLYDRIGQTLAGPIASGTNIDDLDDYRPGLAAAREHLVCHPFVEADCTKEDIRALARDFGLDDISELPAQPCLASRIETGLRVTPEDLGFVEQMEQALAGLAPGTTLRCRVTQDGIRLELFEQIAQNSELHKRVSAAALKLCEDAGRRLVTVAPYRRGSAFRHVD